MEVPRRLRALPRREILGAAVPVAVTLGSRLLGLALLDRDRAGPGLLIPRCGAVHTFAMRFPLDLVFLDGCERVIGLRREVAPGRFVRCRGARAVLELPAPRVG